MSSKTFDRLLFFCLFFLAHWFFGNLYEEIVLAPNQLVSTYEGLRAWQDYFKVTNQIYYYVPFTHLAVLVVWLLYFKAKETNQKEALKRAGTFGLLSICITVAIVTQLNIKLFFGNIEQFKDESFTLSVAWLIGNAVRLYLVGSSLHHTLKAYMLRKCAASH